MSFLSSHGVQRTIRLVAAPGTVACLTYAALDVLHVNEATAGFLYLLLILALAAYTSLEASVLASFCSMLCYNFYFLPPIGQFTIADPQNWIALCAFLITGITASRLSSRASRTSREANTRRLELERIHEFTTTLLIGNTERSLIGQIAQQISELFSIPTVLFYDLESGNVCSVGEAEDPAIVKIVRGAALSGERWKDPGGKASVVSVRLGRRILGSIALVGHSTLSDVAVETIAQAAAIAIERARTMDASMLADAARRHEDLKSTLLDALAHEFKTPLTSIKAATTVVLGRQSLEAVERELLTVADEEADHLNELLMEALQVTRLSSGNVTLRREPFSASVLVEMVLGKLRHVSDGRKINVDIESGLPDLNMDVKLSCLVLRQLLGNAFKYAPTWAPIDLTIRRTGDLILFNVANDGPGIPLKEQGAIFEKFYRGERVRGRIPGTGMGLTIARGIVNAHGGSIWVQSQPGRGVEFLFTLPAIRAQQKVTREQIEMMS